MDTDQTPQNTPETSPQPRLLPRLQRRLVYAATSIVIAVFVWGGAAVALTLADSIDLFGSYPVLAVGFVVAVVADLMFTPSIVRWFRRRSRQS
ncbi:hypothetical protein [Streptomyces sp. NBC_01207]|uniref:hypothetical protein n=1 Tax=Streptomyces sp. NBC_01207 TaxID=2903772 RepID=UPI002E0D3A0E|nr:hypothetical protein OG457_27270 [Streptomyces sp. NBC_01207]